MTVVAMDGDEELRPHEVDHQANLFLAAVSADVDEAGGAVVVDDMRIAAFKVIDHAVDRLLVTGNHAGAEEHRIAGVDLRILVVVDRGSASARMGSPCVPVIMTQDFVRRHIAYLAGIDDRAPTALQDNPGPARSRWSYRANVRR